MGLVSELRRRNVFRMAALYVVAAWLVMQVADVLGGPAMLPDWVGTWILVILAIGFPIALVLSWFYELTPEGISLERDVDRGDSITHITGRRMDFIVIAVLSAAVIMFAVHTWWPRGPIHQSIAVLPFENMSGDPEQEYFSDGISEELLNQLAKFRGLHVISRSSSFSFKGKDSDLRTIAEQLKVAHVLEGSVRRSGDRVRITAQLIDARSDKHLWSETYDRELGDILAVQEQISGAIGEALKVQLSLVERDSSRSKVSQKTGNHFYDEYLKGRERLRLRGPDNIKAAIDHFQRVLRLNEAFAPAHAQLAIAMAFDSETVKEARIRATPHLERAITLDPDLAEAHGGWALLAVFENDWESAVNHSQKALASNPSYLRAMTWLRMGLDGVGRHEQADEVIQRILEIDPLDVITRFNHSWRLASQGRFNEAHKLADSIIAQDKSKGYWAHGQILFVFEGDLDRALYWFLKSQAELTHSFGKGFASEYPTLLFIRIGLYDEARRMAKGVSYRVDFAEGRFDNAFRATQSALQENPGDREAMGTAATALYFAGHFHEALLQYERLCGFAQGETPLACGHIPAMRVATLRRLTGDEDGARAVAEMVASRFSDVEGNTASTAGTELYWPKVARAMLAAFERKPDRAVDELESAIRTGLRERHHLDDIVFDDMRDDPRFIAVTEKLEAILAEERDGVLQLICFDNPTPENWQPLPGTCAGVEERQAF